MLSAAASAPQMVVNRTTRAARAEVRIERMLDDGVADAAALIQQHGLRLDVWTLDAGTPHWEARLARALAAGVDIVTSNTAPALAAAGRRGPA